MTRSGLFVAALGGLGLHSLVSAATIIVGPGQSIQAAINSADPFGADEIVVEPGTYNEKINFMGKAVVLRSSDGPEVTIINGAGQNNAVVTCETGEDVDTILDGFTITGGTGRPGGIRTKGGGMYCLDSNPLVRNCVFRVNTADEGGGMHNRRSDPLLVNCLFYLNVTTALRQGGGMFNDDSNPVIVNTTFALNQALEGGGIYNLDGVTRLVNCIVYLNNGGSIAGPSGSIVTYSDIAGGHAGVGNIDADPLFQDAAGGDLRLKSGSPCVDRGDSTALATTVFKDMDGLPRGQNVPTAPERGIAVFDLTVDLGPYEVQVPCQTIESCEGDIDGPDFVPDGEVGFFDLLVILGNWGPCP